MKKTMFLFFFLGFFTLLIADGTLPAGSGTETDPYQIAILDNLLWLSTTDSVWTSSNYFYRLKILMHLKHKTGMLVLDSIQLEI